ncbi:MAG: permease, partial [Halobacteria archaeon]|nr:permease [Halobacteria archaeon]
RDPVCGMEVNKDEAEHTVTTDGGRTYYFCSKGCKEGFDPEEANTSLVEKATSYEGWTDLADKQWKEWGMLYEDILVGFVLAGIIAAFVPSSVWTSLFSTFSGEAFGLPVFVLWTAALGTVIGVVTFVCSVGNVPFAAVLWSNGLPFGSVLSFIYADLIVPPIMDAYRKYYGASFAALLSGTIFVAAVVTGFIIHFLFTGLGLVPSVESAKIVERSVELNYKAVLNAGFTVVFVALFYLHKKG